MKAIDWFWILHPALAVVLVYPLIGQVARLGLEVRRRRSGDSRTAPLAGPEHQQLGRWLALAVVLISLLALAVVIGSRLVAGDLEGGPGRALQLGLVLLGSMAALLALLRASAPALRAGFALISWIGVLALGAQPEVFRLSDNPLQSEFWQSHYWAGVALVGLMLLALASRREILLRPRWRGLHAAASTLAALLFLLQGITGTRDLLQIPLSWHKPALGACDWARLECPAAPRS
jgi:hypothetical protein